MKHQSHVISTLLNAAQSLNEASRMLNEAANELINMAEKLETPPPIPGEIEAEFSEVH